MEFNADGRTPCELACQVPDLTTEFQVLPFEHLDPLTVCAVVGKCNVADPYNVSLVMEVGVQASAYECEESDALSRCGGPSRGLL